MRKVLSRLLRVFQIMRPCFELHVKGTEQAKKNLPIFAQDLHASSRDAFAENRSTFRVAFFEDESPLECRYELISKQCQAENVEYSLFNNPTRDVHVSLKKNKPCLTHVTFLPITESLSYIFLNTSL